MQSTKYPNVNGFLAKFLNVLQKVLGTKFFGFYLYGSLATGDFDSESSDIDFVVVTKSELNTNEIKNLKKMHRKLADKPKSWGSRVEGAYIPRGALRKYDPKYKQPFLSTTTPFGKRKLGRDWIINRYILREKGIVIYGPNPKTLIDPVSKKELIDTVRNLLCKDWNKHVSGPKWMERRLYQAFTILTMCRALYALEFGEIISKQKAFVWAKANLDKKWRKLIDWAIEKRADNKKDKRALVKTLEFLKFVVASVCV